MVGRASVPAFNLGGQGRPPYQTQIGGPLKPEQFPDDIRPYLIPKPEGDLVYRCLECGAEYDISRLLYTCPKCRGLFLLEDKAAERLKKQPGTFWRRLFDYRKMLNVPALKGIHLFYELITPVIPLKDIIYLGEGHTPQVAANEALREEVGAAFYYKNDGQNPSASFKDRGMAVALSYLNYLVHQPGAGKMLAICASTGDTSAAAALYSAYLGGQVASAVLLPHGKVTPQQLAQPLGSGARVLEIPGVFDDCMKVVEALADNYQVALLNSKNPWRIRGQESYAFEVAQWFDYDLAGKVVVVPIGNAGNITAIMQGFLRLHDLQIIETLPRGPRGPVPPRRPGVPLLPGAGQIQTHLQAGDGDAQRGPGRHDRQPGVHAPGHPAGGGIPPPGRGGLGGGGPGERTGDHGLHAPGQPPRPHRRHPGGRIPGGLPDGLEGKAAGPGGSGGVGLHRPPLEVHRLPADVFREHLSAGVRGDPQTGVPEPAATADPQDRGPGPENRRFGGADRRRCWD